MDEADRSSRIEDAARVLLDRWDNLGDWTPDEWEALREALGMK